MKIYTIIAGANGVGKTSLYHILKSSDDLGERINIDEIVSAKGSWMDKLLQIKATRTAMSMLNKYIANEITFHQETTLPGNVVLKQIKKAKERGFQIRLYFVSVENVDVALSRVQKRVTKGGHGIDEGLIRKRFEAMPEQLRTILPLCDTASFYDNTVRFRRLALTKGDIIFDSDMDLPAWFNSLISDGIVKYQQ
ncbi:MAG: zeta toxin family protein [Clostridia bacterium]|nr:zeta toxin family protein [Clostridia bacterium]